MTRLTVPDMSCAHCAGVITHTLKTLDPQAAITFDMPSHTVDVASSAPLDAVVAALAAAGYPPAHHTEHTDNTDNAKRQE